MTEIKIRVKHRDTEVEVIIPVKESSDAYTEKHLSKFIEDKLKNIVDGIKRLEETT